MLHFNLHIDGKFHLALLTFLQVFYRPLPQGTKMKNVTDLDKKSSGEKRRTL